MACRVVEGAAGVGRLCHDKAIIVCEMSRAESLFCFVFGRLPAAVLPCAWLMSGQTWPLTLMRGDPATAWHSDHPVITPICVRQGYCKIIHPTLLSLHSHEKPVILL